MNKHFSLKIPTEGSMRRQVQIRPGQAIPPKPQGQPVGVPRNWLSNDSAKGASSGKNKDK